MLLKVASVNEKLSKPFHSELGSDAVYNFINCMTEASKYCSEVM